MKEQLKLIITEHAPGRTDGIPELVKGSGIDANVRVVKNYLGEPLPRPEECDAVISGGGPMGIYEIRKGKYEFLKKEGEFLFEMVQREKAVLGICLGHQLLSEVLGGSAGLSSNTAEYGWAKITLNQDGQGDPLFAGVPKSFPSFEFHKDQIFSLPGNAVLLAGSEICPIQAFRYSPQPVWGVQFHPEISPEKAKNILESRKETIEQMGLDVFLLIKQGFCANQQPRKQIFYNFLKLLA